MRKIAHLFCYLFAVVGGLLLLSTSSCVSMRTYRDTQARALRSEYHSVNLQVEIDQLREQREALEAQYGTTDSAYVAQGMTKGELRTLLDERTKVLDQVSGLLNDMVTDLGGEGFSIYEQNGMIYLSVDEERLFVLRRSELSPNGERVVEKMAEVLAKSPNVRIMVEGHTDNLPYRRSLDGDIVDNWDLSVHRATAVVRTLLRNKEIDPALITAAGRSQYDPVAQEGNDVAQQKNRRTEIILIPETGWLIEMLTEVSQNRDETY